MSIKTLQELCTVSVVENFKRNNAVISTYELGNKVCNDIINRLLEAKKVNNKNIHRLQLHGIESLKIDERYVRFSAKFISWLVDIILTGLTELEIDGEYFDRYIARLIVEKYEKKPATECSDSVEPKEPQTLIVPALQTLRIKDHSVDPTFYYLPSMLSIFTSTLKKLEISCGGGGRAEGCKQLFDVIGTLNLDTLSLGCFADWYARTCTVTPSMQHLQKLKFNSVYYLIDQRVLSFLEVASQNVQHLCIRWCNYITDSTLHNIQMHCPNLVSLDLSYNRGNEKMTEAGLESFFATASLSKLERLDLSCNNTVTDAVVAKLATVGHLMYINLSECPNISLWSLTVLANIQTLKYVSLRYNLDKNDVFDFMIRHGLKYCDEYDKLHKDKW